MSSKETPLKFELKLDVIERDKSGMLVKTGTKVFKPADRPMNKWIKRPKATEPALPMVGWYPLVTKTKVRQATYASKSLGWLYSGCNDVQNSAAKCNLTSGVYHGGEGWSVTPDNFLESMVVMACRKLVKPTWLNDRDEFNIPDLTSKYYPQFALDCVIYSLVHGANYSSSLDPVEYKGRTFELRNQFFPFTVDEFAAIRGLPTKVVSDAKRCQDPFVATWLKKHLFTSDAHAVLVAAKELFVVSAAKRMSADPKYQLHRWDAGWYQMRFGLYSPDVKFTPTAEMEAAREKFKKAYKILHERLNAMVYALDVLPQEEVFT